MEKAADLEDQCRKARLGPEGVNPNPNAMPIVINPTTVPNVPTSNLLDKLVKILICYYCTKSFINNLFPVFVFGNFSSTGKRARATLSIFKK